MFHQRDAGRRARPRPKKEEPAAGRSPFAAWPDPSPDPGSSAWIMVAIFNTFLQSSVSLLMHLLVVQKALSLNAFKRA